MAKVKAISPVKHDGELYAAGAVFEVSDRQAKDLKLAGVVKVGKDYRDPDKVAEQELDETENLDDIPKQDELDQTKTPGDLAQG